MKEAIAIRLFEQSGALLRGGLCALGLLLLTSCARSDLAPIASATPEPTAQATQEPQSLVSGSAGSGVTAGEKSSGFGFYFDTVVSVTLYDADETLLSDIWAMCDRYEKLLSKTVEGSDVYRINHADGETVTVDPETWTILSRAKEMNALSGGAFSVTIAPVVALWDFTGGTERMPTAAELEQTLPLVDDTKLVLGENSTVTLPAGMSIDLGGIAKGYIANQVADLVSARSSGSAMSFGGNTYVTGTKPSGAAWSIGIQDPNSDTGTPLLVISLDEGTVVTSGVYERYFFRDGVRYHHILDPQTGISAQTGLLSATVVGLDSMAADAFATCCIVLGPEKAISLLEAQGQDGLLILEDGSILYTEGFAQKYALRSYQ